MRRPSWGRLAVALGPGRFSPFPVQLGPGVDPAAFTTGGAAQHCLVTTGSFDLLEAGPEPGTRQVTLFEDLLAGVEGRFQLLVRSRPAAVATARSAALRSFLEARRQWHPVFHREVSVVLTAAPAPATRLGARWGPEAMRTGAATPAEAAGRAARADAEAAVRALDRMGLTPRLLEGRELERHLDDHLPPCLARGTDDPWFEGRDHLQLDGRLHAGFVLRAYPGMELEPGWLAPLLDTPAEYDLAIHGARLPAAGVLRLLGRRIRDLQAARMSDLAGQAPGDPLVEAGLPEAVGLRRQVAGNEERVFAVAVYLTVVADSPGGLAAAREAVLERATRAMAALSPATFQAAAVRLACLPLGVDPVGHERLLPGSALATLYPWLGDELQQPAGHFVGTRAADASPVLLDPYDEDLFANANIGVFGHSGAGKTFLVRGLLLSDADAGIGGFVIDPESEYRDVCEAIGGEWVDLALGGGASINVLDPALSAVGERDPLGDQVADLLDLLGLMCGSLTDDERVDLDLALRETLGRPGATLRELRTGLLDAGLATRVARSLRRWTEGPMGDLFARPTNLAVDAELVVFSLRDLKEEVVPVAYFLIAQWIWARVRSVPVPRRLLFDEVGLVFEHPSVRRFLVRLARRLRKYQGSLVLVTQNAGGLLSSDQGLVLATNPAILFLGAQRQAEALRLQRAFGLTDSQVAYLASARRGDFLLLAGDRRHRIRVEANPWQLELAALTGEPGPESARLAPR